MITNVTLFKNLDSDMDFHKLKDVFCGIHQNFFADLKTGFSEAFESNRLNLLNKIQIVFYLIK